MTKWEYKLCKPTYEAELVALGAEGWECFHVTPHLEGSWWFFKRPLPPEPITFDNVVSCSTSYAPIDIYAPAVVAAVSVTKEINEG